MAYLSVWEIFIIAAIGGTAGVLGLIGFVALTVAIYVALCRLHDLAQEHRERRRAIKAGRRQLANLTTIDDLKE